MVFPDVGMNIRREERKNKKTQLCLMDDTEPSQPAPPGPHGDRHGATSGVLLEGKTPRVHPGAGAPSAPGGAHPAEGQSGGLTVRACTPSRILLLRLSTKYGPRGAQAA